MYPVQPGICRAVSLQKIKERIVFRLTFPERPHSLTKQLTGILSPH